jgi:hypothetical protein
LIWTKEFNKQLMDLQAGPTGDQYLTGSDTGRLFVGRMDTSGVLLWSTTVIGSSEGKAVIVDDNDFSYVTGMLNDTITVDTFFIWPSTTIGYGGSMFLAKFDPAGTCVWIREAGTSVSPKDISVDLNSAVYITGQIKQTAHFDSISINALSYTDAFISKFDSTGVCQWAKRCGGIHSSGSSFRCDEGNGIQSTSNGTVYFTGTCIDTTIFDNDTVFGAPITNDIFIAKYQTTGNLVWVKRFGGGSDDEGRCLVLDSAENIYIAGSHVGYLVLGPYSIPYIGNYDLFVTKLDSSGTVLWAQHAGGQSWNDFADGITLNSEGEVIVSGRYTDSSAFGGIFLSDPGFNGFIAKLSNPATNISENRAKMASVLYPNPTTGLLTLPSTEIINEISVYSSLGQALYSENYKGRSEITFDVSFLIQGIYLLQVKTEAGIQVKRFIKN